MPVWSKLPEPERWQIVSYLKSLVPAGKPQGSRENRPMPLTAIQPQMTSAGDSRIVISPGLVLR
jgi:hypothetical protein